MKKYLPILFIFIIFTSFTIKQAFAVACTQSAIIVAIDGASNGDTINIDAGDCSWSGITVQKSVTLQGAGTNQTNITLTGDNTFTKQASGPIVVTGISFIKSGGGANDEGLSVVGSWQEADPVIFKDNTYEIDNSGLFSITVPGGVIISGSSFTGLVNDSFFVPKSPSDSDNSWTTDHTMGSGDTTGQLNHYIEGNTFYGGANQGTDCDDASRCVWRYNTLIYSSFNSHGLSTSAQGMRHFEVYNNHFNHDHSEADIANQNQAVWIRGATGTIFDNFSDDLAGSFWGGKPEVKLHIRGAEDNRPQGACEDVSYPVPRQLGQDWSESGAAYVTDPIYIWDNTGTFAISAGWNWGNPCSLTFTDFFSSPRDYITGSPRPDYSAYDCPHPLIGAGSCSGTGATGYVVSASTTSSVSGQITSGPGEKGRMTSGPNERGRIQ